MFFQAKRIFKFGLQGFLRNKGLSFQVIFVMAVGIFIFTSLFVFKGMTNYLIKEAEKKIDISVYFKKSVPEEKITEIKKSLYKFSDGIESVDYISEEKAKEIFLEKHNGDQLYLDALKEVGSNPFLASLDIKAKGPEFYAKISNFLSKGTYKENIEKVSYYKNKDIINRIFSLSKNINNAGIVFFVLMIILIFFVVFNTVKLTILAFDEEITTMKLVGASNWFVRGPFLIQGVLYGFISLIIVDILFYAGFLFISPKFQQWFFNFNLLSFFKNNFFLLLFWQAIFSFALGVSSSFLAVRKYLKV